MALRVGFNLALVVGFARLAPSWAPEALDAAQALADVPERPVLTRDRVLTLAWSLQVRELGRARAAAPDERVTLAGRLYARAASPIVRERALAMLIDEAEAAWPADFRGEFLISLAPAVLRSAREYHVLPSVTLAQAVLESGWGRSGLARRHANLFGVKAGTSSRRVTLPTREYKRGRLRKDVERYRTYSSVDESIAHHARLLSRDRRYSHARSAWTDWRRFLQRISKRYASDPRYVDRIATIVESYDLDRWDAIVVEAVTTDQQREQRSRRTAVAAATPATIDDAS